MATEVSLLVLLFVAEEALKFNAGLHILEKMMQMAGIHVPKIAFCHCSTQIFLNTEFKCLCYSTA
jgi:hypothetical protein